MDPETALELVKQGVSVVLLDVPQHTIFGIDTQVFTVGPLFKGIKMIPPGLHFVVYSSSSKEGVDFSPITGFFFNASPSEVIVRKWDIKEERLVKLNEVEEDRYCRAVKNLEFDKHLGPYNLIQYGEWKRLSNYLTKNVIGRIEPIDGDISVAGEADRFGSNFKTKMERILHEQLSSSQISSVSSGCKSERKGCKYTFIPRVIKSKGANVEELTSMNLDKTKLLERILLENYEGSEDMLLGELQFSFVAFLMAQSLEAFLQWKSLVTLLLGCIEAPFHSRTQLFIKFIKVIHFQLKFGLQDTGSQTNAVGIGNSPILDESWFSGDSFLYQLCKDFILMVQESPSVDGHLLSWTRKLRDLLENSLGFQFPPNDGSGDASFMDDEFAPVVELIDP